MRFSIVLCQFFLPIMAMLSAIILLISLPINGDVGWLFFATKQWIAGKELYREIFEVNPPMIFYFMAPSVYIYNIFNLDSVIVVKLYLFFLVSIMVSVNLRLFYRILGREALISVYITFSIAMFYIYPFYDFAQRDHLAILLMLPYLLNKYLVMFDNRRVPNMEGVAYGVMAGLSICLKPHFILLTIFCEIFWLIKHREFKRVFDGMLIFQIIMVSLFACYIFIYEKYYIDEMIPLAIATYWTYGLSLDKFNLIYYFSIFTFIVFSSEYLKSKRSKVFIRFMSVMTFAALIEFLLQSHYSYQLLPFKTLLYINLFNLYIAFFYQLGFSKPYFKSLTFLVLALTSGFGFYRYIDNNLNLLRYVYENQRLPSFKEIGLSNLDESVSIINRYFNKQNIYVVSTNVWPSAFISNYTTANWISGFPALWPLPAIVQSEHNSSSLSKEVISKIESEKPKVLNIIAKEIEYGKPSAILIDSREFPSYFYSGFSYLDFFKSQPILNGVLDDYCKFGLKLYIGNNVAYEVYIRRDINLPCYSLDKII
ncbi:hypothetical protein JYB88_15910 [Shewanella cyperi]|uniref:Uncharacterized protein n=1 Tax=Shewanella cyperi TaxID=2814292 RepID=A0A974XJQ9_9GAMM|nr:hypothetical protein [Shewanella cyperi]QSX29659.1 hypothetical protein JYB88_15910 [Shewanella cyperi]